MTPRPEQPATAAGRALLAFWEANKNVRGHYTGGMLEDILAIEREASGGAATGVAGAAAALPDVAELARALRTRSSTDWLGLIAKVFQPWPYHLSESLSEDVAAAILAEIERARGDSK